MRGRTDRPSEPAAAVIAPVAHELFEARPVKYKPTQFLMADDMKKALKDRAHETDRSMSELVREAVEEYLRK